MIKRELNDLKEALPFVSKLSQVAISCITHTVHEISICDNGST